jgi:hypothetical protein
MPLATPSPELTLARVGEDLYFVNALADMQPDLRMLHTGRPPTRGDKWIVSQFVRSRASLTAAPATSRTR